jgi:DNA transposition AAA+ family ATPase
MKTYKELKDLCGMTELTLARFHGVSRATVQNWISGKRRVPADSYEKLENYVERKFLS